MRFVKEIARGLYRALRYSGYKNISNSSRIDPGVKVFNKSNLVMGINTNIDFGAVIMNTRAKLIIKDYSGAAFGLTVVTGNHISGIVGKYRKMITDADKDTISSKNEFDKDVIVQEDVWIGSNVTLLSGTIVGRGAIIGSGTVVRTSIPPYAIAIGNPAKIIGFVFSPQEAIEHEKKLYPVNQRLDIKELENNYSKYFTKRIKDISNYIKL